MPNVHFGIIQRGLAIGVNGSAWPITAILTPPRSNIFVRGEDRILELGVADVLRQERKRQLVDDLLDARLAERELPVPGHGVGREQVHGSRPCPGPLVFSDVQLLVQVSPPSSSSTLPAAFGADRLDHGGDAIETAHAPVAARRAREVLVGQRVGLGDLPGAA